MEFSWITDGFLFGITQYDLMSENPSNGDKHRVINWTAFLGFFKIAYTRGIKQ